MYKCEILADSISPQGHRITTYKVTYPRIIHAEMCRHRTLSRNSASSRAIPFKKMVKMVEEDPFIPIAWQADHKGMQGTEYIHGFDPWSNKNSDKRLEEFWLEARNDAIKHAKFLNNNSLTKQLCNRLLEPFMWHTELITGTEWENFFELRAPKYKLIGLGGDPVKSRKEWLKRMQFSSALHPSQYPKTEEEWWSISESSAEIHIQALAEAMWDAMNESTPKELKSGEWHIPFGDKMNEISILAIVDNYNISDVQNDLIEKAKIQIATARAARLSYMTFDGEIDYEKDIALHDQLLSSRHMSPFEHCAKAMTDEEYFCYHKGMVEGEFDCQSEIGSFFRIIEEPKFMGDKRNGWCNNFRGWVQYRYLVENK